jgi:23S rRNA (guanosine2251-2'-O)-methyltransferase
MKTRLIMGKNCLKEVLKRSPERIVKVYTSKRTDLLVHEMKEKRIPVAFCQSQRLSLLVRSESHQSFVAKVKELPVCDLKNFFKREKCLIVFCDGITDPQNMGAILRASECFGVSAVVWSKNRNVDITPTVSKVSVGASEIVPIIRISNLADAVRKCKEAGFEIVVAEGKDGALSLYSFSLPEKMVLIMGAEGKGVQPLLRKISDYRVKIPMLGKIDSLNVSQATSVLLSFWAKQA